MKLQTKSNVGNFAIAAECEVTDSQRDVLASFGLLQILQRSPASAAEKAMAGYEKRPEGFKRDSIPFNAENVHILKAAMSEVSLEVGRDDANKAITEKLEIDLLVSEYVPETSGPKFAEERKTYVGKKGDKTRLQALATKVGFKGDIGDGSADGAPEEFLRAMRDWKRAALND